MQELHWFLTIRNHLLLSNKVWKLQDQGSLCDESGWVQKEGLRSLERKRSPTFYQRWDNLCKRWWWDYDFLIHRSCKLLWKLATCKGDCEWDDLNFLLENRVLQLKWEEKTSSSLTLKDLAHFTKAWLTFKEQLTQNLFLCSTDFSDRFFQR